MKSTLLFALALSSRALAGEWKMQKRDLLTVTSTVYSTTYYCPCTTSSSPLSSSTSSISSSISYESNSGSVGSPLLTSASATSSISTVPSSFVSSSSTTATSAVASSSRSSTSSASGAGSTVFVSAASLGDYRTTVLSSHNIHRVNHTVSDLTWSDTMAQYAAQIASSCVYAHSK